MVKLFEMIRSGAFLRHKLVKNTAALVIVQMSSYAAPLVVVPYLSRVLSTAHYGLIAFAVNFNWYFITFVEYGFNLTATRRIAIHQNDPAKVSQIFSSVLAAKALLTVVGFLMMVGVVAAVPKLRPDLLLFCLCYLAVIGDLLFPLWLFQGLQKMENLVWRDLLAKFAAAGLIFAFVHGDADYLKAAGFQAGSTVLAGILGLISVPLLTQARFVRPSLREIFIALREGWPVFLSMAAMTLSSSTNAFLLGLKSGPTDVAYYSASYRLIVAIRMLVSPLVTAIYPHMSHMAVASREDAVTFLRKYGFVMAAPFLLASAVLFFGAAPIIHLVYSAKYQPAVPLLRIMALAPFLLAVQHVYSTFYMLAFGYEKEWSRVILQTAVLNFVILIPLIYLIWPPQAVSITNIVLDLFVAAVTYLFFRRHTATIPQAAAA
ncbi:MAG TPA: flippase [Bryobacteraceae bacterium]|jgi:PST family polysaccharide transporter